MTIGVVQFYQQMNGLYPVDQSAVDAACAHALEVFPQESCGIVYRGKYHPCQNVHENPTEDYRIALKEQLSICKPDKIEAVIHSHPNGLEGFTGEDLQAQIAANVPFGVITVQNNAVTDVLFCGDQVPIAPYDGRPFKSGMYDCFGDARDWLRQERKLLLPNYPRHPNWWADAKSPELLEEKMADFGFFEIGIEALRPGDAFLAKPFRSLKVCHCGIYLGDGLIYHHFGTPNSDRLSVTESIYDMQRYIVRFIRHKDLDVQPSASGG